MFVCYNEKNNYKYDTKNKPYICDKSLDFKGNIAFLKFINDLEDNILYTMK